VDWEIYFKKLMSTHLPAVVVKAVSAIEKLPGIGPKSATRLVFYLLNTPDEYVEGLASNLIELKKKSKFCQICFSVCEQDLCEVCKDDNRKKMSICVVERSIDVINFERTGVFDGVYHVLGGAINPLERIGPDDLKIDELVKRVKELGSDSEERIEIILATSLTMEGEATALYIKNRLDKLELGENILINRIGMGLPVGSDLSYVDEATLSRALEGKRKL